MSKRDTLELTERLLAAARADRPSPALARRLSLIERARGVAVVPHVPMAASGGALERGAEERAVGARRSWSLAALTACAAVYFSAREAPPSISKEHRVKADIVKEERARAAAEAAIRPGAPEPTPQARAATPSAPERPAESKGRASTRPIPKPVPAQPPTETGPAKARPLEPAPKSALSRDINRLTESRAALRSGDGRRALAILDDYSRSRADRALEAEATLLRLEALKSLGRHAEVEALAQSFVRENPDSALADRAKRFLGNARGKPSSDGPRASESSRSKLQ